MARKPKQSKKFNLLVAGDIVPPEDRSLSVPAFCLAEDMSVSAYYKLKRQRKGPKETRYLGCVRITPHDRREWQLKMQQGKALREAKLEQARRMQRIKKMVASEGHRLWREERKRLSPKRKSSNAEQARL